MPLLPMKLPSCLSAMLLAVGIAHADFKTSQSADLVIGGVEPAGVVLPSDIAVDPVTQKVFVADAARHRVLRFSSQASLQNGGLAEAVFGATEMLDQSSGTSASKMQGPQGICVDAGGRLWVADTGNHRVLRFDNARTAPSGIPASVVLGQANFHSAVSAAQANRMNMPQDVEIDSAGRLWVADSMNHRVLRFDNAANRSSGVNADGVLGQLSLTTASPGTSQTEMYAPTGLAVENSGGTTVRLWVVDWYNSRVIGFDNPGTSSGGVPADKLLGQANWSASFGTGGPNRFNRPYKAAVENGSLWVADHNNSRALHFSNAGSKAIGADADLVLGQLDFYSLGGAPDAGFLAYPACIAAFGGRVWIGDSGQRVVRHDAAATKGNGTDADGVIGWKSTAPATLGSASAMAIDSVTGKLFVSDPTHHRVLRYASTASLHAGSQPEAVLGQPNLTTVTSGTSATKMTSPGSLAVDAYGNLWVVDRGNHRVLRFAGASTAASGAAAAQVLGQTTFTAGSSGLAANRFYDPVGIAVEIGINASFQVVVRRLWVSDRNNKRVLRFESPLDLGNGANASGVLGAPNLTTVGTGSLTASGLDFPGALTVEFGGRLWVADVGNRRVLRFDAAASKANNGNADGVLFQSNFTTKDPAAGADVTCLTQGPNGRLYANRFKNNNLSDLVWFNNAAAKANGASPDGILGDPARIHSLPGRATVLDSAGRLWTGNGSNLMRFTPELESRITGFGFNAQNRFTLTILGVGGETYQIRSSTDLQNWTTIERTDTVPGTGTQILTWTASAPPNGPKKFYRLQTP